jgi:hypothetical protein
MCRFVGTQKPKNGLGDYFRADLRLKVKISWISLILVEKVRYRIQLHVETVPV